MTQHLITGALRHPIDVGLGGPMAPGTEFNDADVPDHMKGHMDDLMEQGVVIKGTVKQQEKKAEGD
jgi:hypothetical protein